MPITLTDFDKIWGSTSPLTPYTFSDANYKEGWNFIGVTPPARQMWDSYMKWSDEKQQYIVKNFLPLSGGTMTGSIVSDGNVINNATNASNTNINGGNGYGNGSTVVLYGKNHTTNAGDFQIRAYDGNTDVRLIGKPDGTLSWNGLDLSPQSWVTSTFTDTSVANNTMENIGSYALTKGTWLVIVSADFPTNATGFRQLVISATSGGSEMNRYNTLRVAAASGASTHIVLATIDSISASSITRYVNVKQTSGSALTVASGYIAFRLSNKSN